MSILKSTNSGTYKILTIEDILARGWRFELKQLRSRITGMPISAGGISGGMVEDKTKMYFIHNNNVLNVVQEGSQLFLEGTWKYDMTINGKDYEITKTIKPRTIHDFDILEKHFKLSDVEEQIINYDNLFSAGFTETTVEMKPAMGSAYSSMGMIRTMSPMRKMIDPEDDDIESED